MINYSFPGLVGRIDRIEAFESRYVIPRIVDIWVPPIYDVEPDTKFAVLYMHDGENLFNPANSKFSHMDWGIDETVTRLMQEKKIRPTIVVGMWSTEKRAIEYMPQKLIESRARNRLYSSMQDEVGGTPVSDLYLIYIVKEVKPYIDSCYRTLPDFPNTYVMGSSMGGLISLYAACEYPRIFAGAGCVSTAFPIARGITLGYMKQFLPKAGRQKFYFDYGTRTLDKNYEHYQNKADEIMAAHGYTPDVDWITRKFEGHKHSEVDWRKRVHIPLEFLLKFQD